MSSSIRSNITILVPPRRPDRDLRSEIDSMVKRVERNGLKKTVGEILAEYYGWEEEPDPVMREKKRRATLIFSKSELKRIIALEVSALTSGHI